MCGIVAYIGEQNATPIILNGLKKLEYRGYDSAGLAVVQNDKIKIRRKSGKIAELEKVLLEDTVAGNIGIGHTRWATHGEPITKNAHPHVGMTGDVVIVHNGIVENFLEIREHLQESGCKFNSDTDTESIVHLLEHELASGCSLEDAVVNTLKLIRGAHGIVVLSNKEPDKIICARLGNAGGVVVGVGDGEMFVASDLPAILEHTRKVGFLESGQYAIIQKDGFEVKNLGGETCEFEVQTISWDPVSAEKGEYRHFMQKEIHEQVRSLNDTLAGRVDFEKGKIRLDNMNLTPEFVKDLKRIYITACGTAAYAGMIGEMYIEHFARIPVEVDVASEFRYRNPIVDENTAVLAISQSGETADTLAAMEEARSKGGKLWSIVNAIGTQVMRIADGTISMQTGPEIGVASTKAFTAPIVDQYLLGILLGQMNGKLSDADANQAIQDLRLLPDIVGRLLDREEDVSAVAEELRDIENALYLGRGINMPIAYEGALKLKEITYIHAEAYPAGEMKHGPIALIDESMPVIAIAPRDPWYEKMISQIEQVKARGGIVIAVATDGDERIASLADHVLWIPEIPWLLSPIACVIPLQLLAYHIATIRGLDVDQPRNLAKSVTVE
ncbi:MAG: glutamine--fructose-6-phosphate transaminase (isomerizing) [Anaerolineaceae bacterium]|nr:glutamine--fructose-6-phosphate transaminase (isomerizing) [Anaerolineaceae bacterium]